jgi:hypothetical protein
VNWSWRGISNGGIKGGAPAHGVAGGITAMRRRRKEKGGGGRGRVEMSVFSFFKNK